MLRGPWRWGHLLTWIIANQLHSDTSASWIAYPSHDGQSPKKKIVGVCHTPLLKLYNVLISVLLICDRLSAYRVHIKTGSVCLWALCGAAVKVPIHVRVWLVSPPRGAWLGSQARIYFTTHTWVDSQTLLVHFSIQNDFIEASCSGSDNTRWMWYVWEKKEGNVG
jgi:hypothetical protein